MTPRDIILANLNRTDPPRSGLDFDGGRRNDFLGAGASPPSSYTPKRWTEGNREFYDDQWGNLWVRMVGRSAKGEICKPVLTDWRQLDDLRPPDYTDPACWQGMQRAFAQPTDRYKLAYIGGWVFDDARYLRKMEVYFRDMALYPEELDRLHRVVASVFEAKIHGAAAASADGIAIGEDLGTQKGLLFSPAMFRRYFKAEYTRLLGIAHDYGLKVWMHSCGLNWALLDDLMDCGIDAFQFDQPAVYDMPALAEKLARRKVALWSPVDIQQVLPTGDRAFIEAETRRLVDTFRGGLILKNYPDLPGIGVQPEWDMWAYETILKIVDRGS